MKNYAVKNLNSVNWYKKVNKSISLMEKTNPVKLFYKITPLHKEFIENDIDFYIISININGNSSNF